MNSEKNEFRIIKYRLKVGVLERENDVALGTTKANSAILHAGYDPEPDTKMARLNVEGVRMAEEICAKLDVPYRKTGSLVLAFSEEDRALLRTLLERGEKLAVPSDISLLQPEDGFASLVSCQIDLYKDTKAVKKTLTIPSWLNDRAMSMGVNFSLALQEALISKIQL